MELAPIFVLLKEHPMTAPQLSPTLLFAAVSLFALAAPSHAGQPMPEPPPATASPFDRGTRELQLGPTAFFSVANNDHGRDKLNDAGLAVRFGTMLNSPSGPGCLRGNCELLGELFATGIYEGPGDVLLGGTVFLRYNFVQPEAAWVPYFQLGVGGVYSNAYNDHSQRVLGSAVEFNLQASLGLRRMMGENRAFFIEGGYRHISNAGLADRNIGLNSLGVTLGVSWFF